MSLEDDIEECKGPVYGSDLPQFNSNSTPSLLVILIRQVAELREDLKKLPPISDGY